MKKSILLLSICLLPLLSLAQGLRIRHLTGNLYTYTTWQPYEGGATPANGMYLVTKKGVVIIDTPWDTTQIKPLNDSIAHRHHQPVVMVIGTHWHGDRSGGFDTYKRIGIQTWSSQLTYNMCKENHKPLAAYTFTKDTTFHIGGYAFSTFYPGEGHTKDNIVIWFGKDKVLDGGCFIKGADATDLGYVAESNLKAWPESIDKVKKAFPDARYVIPGHQEGTSPAALDRTSELAKAATH
jgi:metallo-beta-lactamase class B